MPAGQTSLLVDEGMNRDMLSRHLRRRGQEVALALDGGSDLALIRGHLFDSVLLEIVMPGSNELEVLKQ